MSEIKETEKVQHLAGICFCQDKTCDKIYPARLGIPKEMFDEIPTLPCGHKLQSVVFSAKSLRQDAEDAKKLHDLKFRKRYDDDDYLDTSDDLK